MQFPRPPDPVDWSRVYQLQAEHFVRSDTRTELLAFLAAAVGEPWPWGFFDAVVDETALASGELRVRCAGVFPSGTFFSAAALVQKLPAIGDAPGGSLSFHIASESRDSAPALRSGEAAPSERTLPIARMVSHRGVWSLNSQWSPPALLVGPDHPLRTDAAEALAGLAGLAAGFMTTLRMPGAEERAAARRLATVSALLVQGVGVMEAYLASPFVTPGRLGIEARRLALGVRAAAGVFDPLSDPWNPADQRGSLRTILGSAQATASRLGLPFRASVFRVVGDDGRFVAEGLPRGQLSLGVEAARASDLMAARRWLEGAALAAPDKIEEALNRRVAGCAREPVPRDPQIGVSSGPLLALYRVSDDIAWRSGSSTLALAAKTPPPGDVSFLIFVPELEGNVDGESPDATYSTLGSARSASWAGGPR